MKLLSDELASDADWMRRALDLAAQGRGAVEPNPMVGCVIVHDGTLIASGFHRRFGGPHAEVEALAAAGNLAGGATLYVTLEPCCHFGKTPPCADAIINSGVARVVVAVADPFPQVSGRGIAKLRAAGIQVDVGCLASEATSLNAPYLKLLNTKTPWVIAKWAMTLDGRIATKSGSSRWISNATSHAIVHQLRGQVDAIVVGRRTVEADDPLLTARPRGARVATRIVLTSSGALPSDSKLFQTIADAPLLLAVGEQSSQDLIRQARDRGAEVVVMAGASSTDRLRSLLCELGSRRMTNVLVEGGSQVLGSFFDADLVDECHVFVAPKIIGGLSAMSPIAGLGLDQMNDARRFEDGNWQSVEGDLYYRGRINRKDADLTGQSPNR